MSPLEYVIYSLPWWDEYLALLVISMLLHWFILIRPCTRGVYDPLFFVLISSSFGWAIVWFMYLRGDIADVYVTSFTLCELAFGLGLYLARGRRNKYLAIDNSSNENPILAIGVFVISSIIHISTTITIWIIAGIPLFRPSRLGAFANSGGLGILERLNSSCGQIALFTALYFLISNNCTRRKGIYYFFIGWFFISVIFAGSKSGLLSIGYYIFSVAFLYTKLRERKDSFFGGVIGKRFFGGVIIFSMIVISVQNNSDVIGSFLHLIFRLISSGDVYIEAYISNNIEELKGTNPFIGLFGGFLSTFRLFDVNQIHTNIGLQLTWLVLPDIDIIVGPNPRHPVFGYHYFGAGAFIFSFVLGLITSRLNNMFFLKQHKSFVGSLISFMIYFSLVSISTDFGVALGSIASSIIGLGFVFIPLLLIFPRAKLFNARCIKSSNAIPDCHQKNSNFINNI